MVNNDASFVIFSGGSACNHIANAFQSITPNVCYVLGISDNGGSTFSIKSELLRVLGGPSIGDLRSRLTRLINVDGPHSEELVAIKELLSYRLPPEGDEYTIRDEWSQIVEGRHRLWDRIPTEKKETIRGFLVLFNFEILKRAHKHFNFRNGSIGNFFLTGARLFFGSLEAAIFLFESITAIREPTHVIPVINTNHTAAIAALLEDGHILRGQCEISHPGETKPDRSMMNPIDAFSRLALPNSPNQFTADEDAMNGNLVFSKRTEEKLTAAIKRIFYINLYAQEIYPWPNPKVIAHLASRRHLVYSIGSLYTSILPCLILRSVGHAIANSPSLKHKILLLNGTPDRETDGYTAMDFIGTITNALNESQLIDARHKFYDDYADGESALQTIYSQDRSDLYARPVDHGFRQWPPQPLKRLQIQTRPIASVLCEQPVSNGPLPGTISGTSTPPFPVELVPNLPPSRYITHLVYLANSGIPVDVTAIEKLGICCIEIQPDLTSEDPRYSAQQLQRALNEIIKD
ncbi:hypothetical protein EC973_004633 [Apophysomyces ossiformis]|uniref:Uncharacterized protein n=1 Tax=Apophysomyces ossiformis TaxID=679940 RepID=A0A8H7BFS3_9FUNG|nr:hypothetical protein EC973_004633 [Apophysomyces ossiformis]